MPRAPAGPASAPAKTSAAPKSGRAPAPASVSVLPPPGSEDVLYLVDLSGYVYRAYHAVPPLSNSKGEPTHAVMGTVSMNFLSELERAFCVSVKNGSPLA